MCCVSRMCLQYLVLKFLPVCPKYLHRYLMHFIWYIQLLLYLSVFRSLGWRWLCIVFLNNLAMILVSIPMYVKVAHFCFCVVLVFFWFGI
jgi:hypothetical protein